MPPEDPTEGLNPDNVDDADFQRLREAVGDENIKVVAHIQNIQPTDFLVLHMDVNVNPATLTQVTEQSADTGAVCLLVYHDLVNGVAKMTLEQLVEVRGQIDAAIAQHDDNHTEVGLNTMFNRD